ncbi:MAG: entericidin A/B family lipoprotein [Akkermansiaceae bacterium]
MNPIIISKLNCQNSKPSKIRVFTVAAGAAMILMAGATSSCSTARGFGQDVEKTGDKIQDAATR